MKQLIEQYAQGYDKLREAVHGLSEGELRFQPAPGKWSIHEILVHVADAEIVGIQRLKKVLAEDQPILPVYDQDAWANKLSYDQSDAQQHLQLFALLRESMLPILRTVSTGDWSRIGIHSEAGPLTFHQLLQKYVDHVSDHLKQIERVLQANRESK